MLRDADQDDVRAPPSRRPRRCGLIDVDVVRPTIDLYAVLLAESRRRDRAVIESLAAAVEAKDSVTSRHLRRVSRLATQLAEIVDPEIGRTEEFLFGCLLHDVGKIGVPEDILSKPGPLTRTSGRSCAGTREIGARVVRPARAVEVVVDVVLYHHERWDGGGYPQGLSADDIPLVARIFSVCDALEAMTAMRRVPDALPASVAYGASARRPGAFRSRDRPDPRARRFQRRHRPGRPRRRPSRPRPAPPVRAGRLVGFPP